MGKTVLIFMMLAVFVSLCALFFIIVSNLIDNKKKSKKDGSAKGSAAKDESGVGNKK